jgi:hypothetical protein
VLFETLAQNLTDKDYSIYMNALPDGVSQELGDLQNNIPSASCHSVGVGRSDSFHVDRLMRIRKDQISWIGDVPLAGVA